MKRRETKGREMNRRERTSPSLPIKPSSLLILRTFAFFAIFLRNLRIRIHSISRDFRRFPTFCNIASPPEFEGFVDVSDHLR